MKAKLLFCLAAMITLASTAAFAADDDKSVDAGAVIAMCEDQYTAEAYPNDEERNQLIEQCISDNSAKGSE